MHELRDPTSRTASEALVALFRRRDLVWEFTRRDWKVRTRGTVLGVGWTLLHPLLLMAVMTVVFSYGLRMQVERYPLFFLCGQLPWAFLSATAALAARSFVEQAPLVKRAAFPREAVPVSVALSGFAHLLISMLLLLLAAVAFGGRPTVAWLAMPGVLLTALVLATGMAMFVSCLTPHLRDTEQLVPILTQIGYFATPVFYPLLDASAGPAVPPWLFPWLCINPAAGLIESVRAIVLGGVLPPVWCLAVPAGWAAFALAIGVFAFRRLEGAIPEKL